MSSRRMSDLQLIKKKTDKYWSKNFLIKKKKKLLPKIKYKEIEQPKEKEELGVQLHLGEGHHITLQIFGLTS